jgi:tRNA-binding EMAP/Myf-like protein
MVDIGDGKPIQVVCGAPNARAGMKGVFSAPGTFIPGKNITLTVGTIRGVATLQSASFHQLQPSSMFAHAEL